MQTFSQVNNVACAICHRILPGNYYRIQGVNEIYPEYHINTETYKFLQIDKCIQQSQEVTGV